MKNVAAHPGFKKKVAKAPKEEVGPKKKAPAAKKPSATKKKESST